MNDTGARGPGDTWTFACSGASNLGQMANEAALRLREAGKAVMSCTAGIGGHVKGLVDGTRSARLLVGIDGCSVGCVKKCLEGEGLSPGVYMVISEELNVIRGTPARRRRKWQRCSAGCARTSRGS